MTFSPLPYRKSGIPPGISGKWVLENFVVPPVPFDPALDTRPDWAKSPPGQYTRLRCGNEVFMTDVLDEWWTQKSAIEEANRRGGRILITGLGLGLIVESILGGPDSNVTQITVIEQSSDVIQLVGPTILARFPDHLEIIQADAFTWQPPDGIHYSVVWHDIWPNPHDPRNLAEIERLHARYQAYCDWQSSWTVPFRTETP